MMAAEGSFLSAVIARLPEPKYNLAAFGLSFALTLFIEAPLLNLISASNSLVRDWDALIRMRRFAWGLIGVVTLIMGMVLWPPVFYSLTERLIGLPPEVSRLTFLTAVVLLPVPWAIGYRRFYQGLLIQQGRTRLVALGTLIRLVIMALTGICLFYSDLFPGAQTGAWALSSGVVLEALSSRLMANATLKVLKNPEAPALPSPPPLTYRDIASFYLPLVMTSILALGINPVISYFLAQGRQPIESLAAWPVIQALLLIFMSFGLSFHETAIALLGPRQENALPLRRFALILGVGTTGVFALFGFSPLAGLWFRQISGLTPELADFIRLPVRLLTFMPLLWMLLTYERSVLVNARRTAAITRATALEIGLIVLVMAVGIRGLEAIGLLAACLALVAGRLGSVTYLIGPVRQSLGPGPDPAENNGG